MCRAMSGPIQPPMFTVLIKDAPGHRAVAAVGGLDEGALDAGLEDGGAGGQQYGAGEKAPVT